MTSTGAGAIRVFFERASSPSAWRCWRVFPSLAYPEFFFSSPDIPLHASSYQGPASVWYPLTGSLTVWTRTGARGRNGTREKISCWGEEKGKNEGEEWTQKRERAHEPRCEEQQAQVGCFVVFVVPVNLLSFLVISFPGKTRGAELCAGQSSPGSPAPGPASVPVHSTLGPRFPAAGVASIAVFGGGVHWLHLAVMGSINGGVAGEGTAGLDEQRVLGGKARPGLPNSHPAPSPTSCHRPTFLVCLFLPARPAVCRFPEAMEQWSNGAKGARVLRSIAIHNARLPSQPMTGPEPGQEASFRLVSSFLLGCTPRVCMTMGAAAASPS